MVVSFFLTTFVYMSKKRKEVKLIQPKKKRRRKKNKFITWCKDWYDVIDLVIYSFTPNWLLSKENKKNQK